MTPENTPTSDLILEMFIGAAETHGMSFEITVLTQGAVISGRVISFKEYAGKLAQHFDETTVQSSAEISNLNTEDHSKPTPAYALNMRGLVDHVYGTPDGKIKKDKYWQYLTEYLHLADAKLISGGSNMEKLIPSLWRIKLDHISGIAFGEAGAS